MTSRRKNILKNKIRNKVMLVIIIAIGVMLFLCVAILMNSVQRKLYLEVQNTLEEIVVQNRDVISNKLFVEMSSLKNNAELLQERLKYTDLKEEDFKEKIKNFVEERDLSKRYYIANAEGKGFFSDGDTVDISSRDYFAIAMRDPNNSNMSERLPSRKDGEQIFVFCVPLVVKEKTVGTLQKYFSVEEMFSLCEVSLFSSQGTMSIIDKDGYIMISNENELYNQIRTNYFTDVLYVNGDKSASEKLQKDMELGNRGAMEVLLGENKFYSSYAEIPSVHGWYLITSVSVDAVSSNSNEVILTFYIILFTIVLVFVFIILTFFSYKNKQKAQLERIAFVDTITKGSTFTKFVLTMKEILEESGEQTYGLVAFDIDNFKYLNSFFGFDFGDNVLKEIYSQISQKLQYDELIARVNGDHFAMLLNCTELEGEDRIEAIQNKVMSLLDVKLKDSETVLYITSGLYFINNITENPNIMLDKASIAAKSVKGAIKQKCAIYDNKYDEINNKNEQLKRKIEHAIQEGEIVPFYQPKININTRELVGAEALARWITKDNKIISPADFIPLAESTGQIVDIDLAVFESVLKFLEKNIAENITCMPISVNFSRHNLRSRGFVHNIMGMVNKYNIPPNLIQIELTESVIFDNNDTILEFVNHLHIHGLEICIDDFGSGYSSLNMLKDIPVDVLKIDKAFLDGVGNMNRQKLILSAIVAMAKDLKMDIVVEGVETEENVLLMKSIGCDIAQGYFYARPMSEDKFKNIFLKGSL